MIPKSGYRFSDKLMPSNPDEKAPAGGAGGRKSKPQRGRGGLEREADGGGSAFPRGLWRVIFSENRDPLFGITRLSSSGRRWQPGSRPAPARWRAPGTTSRQGPP